MVVGAVGAALVAGFVTGLVTFKVKDRWCPGCGATTSELARRPVHEVAGREPAKAAWNGPTARQPLVAAVQVRPQATRGQQARTQ